MVISVEPETIPQLIKLQKKDSQIQRIQSLLEEIPRLRETRQKKFAQQKSETEAIHLALQKQRLLSKEADAAVHQKEMDIKKMNAQLNTANSNEEYRALQNQIARVEGERDALVDQGLNLLEDIENAEVKDGEAQATLQEAHAALEAFSKQLDEDKVGFDSDLEQLFRERAVIAATIKKNALDVYERVLNAREGVAVVRLVGKICQGCFVTLTTNDVVHLHSGKELITCSSCSRILFDE